MAVSSALGSPIGALPAGSVIPYAGTTSPAGWLLCYGQAVSRTDYGALFAVIGTTYGSGDGSTTFTLPDLRGRVVAGIDNMGGSAASRLTSTTITGGADAAGEVGGAQTHTLTSGESGVPAHTHTITDPGHVHNVGLNLNAINVQNAASSYIGSSSGNWNTASNTTGITINNNTAANASSAHNNVQPTMVMNYIIKAVAY